MTRHRRVLIIVLVVGLVAVAGGLIALRGPLEERLRRAVVARASGLLAAPVSVSDLRVSFAPVGVHLSNLSLSPAAGPGLRAAGAVERIDIRGNPLALLGWRHRPIEIAVSRPRLRLFSIDGTGSPGAPRQPMDLSLENLGAWPAILELRVRDGEVELSPLDGLVLRLAGVSLDARSGLPPVAVAGHVGFTDGMVQGPAGDREGLQGECEFELVPEGVRLDPLTIRGAGLDLAAQVLVRLAPPVALEGNVDLQWEVESLARYLSPAAQPAGRLEASLEGRWGGSSLQGEGGIALAALSLWGLQIDDVSASLRLDGGIHLEQVRARLLGGEGTGSVDVALPAQGGVRLRGNLTLDGMDLERLLDFAGWTGPQLAGTLHYEGEHTLDERGLESLQGSGRADAAGSYRAPSGADLPIRISVRLENTGATIRLDGGTIEAGSVSGRFSGSLTPDDGLRLRLKGASGNLSEILPLFAPPARGRSPAKRGPSSGTSPGGGDARAASRTAAGHRVRHAVWTGGRSGPRPAVWSGRGYAVRPAIRTAARSGARSAPAEQTTAPGDGAGGQSALETILHALGGRWEWDGDLQYSARGLGFEGTLTGSGLTYGGLPLGAMRARVAYHDETLEIHEATLTHPEGGDVRLSGEVNFGEAGRIDINARTTGFPARALLAFAGGALPLDGVIGARVRLGGRPDDLEVHAEFESGPIAVAGLAFDRLGGTVVLDGHHLTVRDLVLTQGAGSVTVTGTLPYAAAEPDPAGARDGGGDTPRGLSVAARNVDLSGWLTELGGVPLAGTLTAGGRIGGTLETPAGTLTARVENVRVWDKPFGAVTIEAGLEGASVNLRGGAPERDIEFEGCVGLGEGRALDLKVTFSDTEIKGEEILAGAPEGGSLVLSGGLSIGGSYDRLSDVSARMGLETLRVTLPGVEIANEGPVDAVLEGGRLRLDPVVMIGSGTRVDVRGEVDVAFAGSIDAAARGTFDLALLRFIAGHVQATGQGDIEVSIGGTRDVPILEGGLRVAATRVRYADLPFPINDLDGRLVFDGSRLRIESLRMLAGGGEVVGSGGVLLGDTAAGRGPLAIRSAELDFRGSDVNAEFPDGFRSLSDIDLKLVYDGGVVVLSGGVDLIRGIYHRDFDVESSVVRGQAPGLFDLKTVPGPLEALQLDLTLRAAGDVWLRNDFGSMEGRGDLRVTGTVGQPSVAGRIEVEEGGTIRFNKVRYVVQSGALDFTDPVAINPVFDLGAESTVGTYQVNLKIEGTIDDFSYELTSSPPLPQQDIVALLLTGRTLGDLGHESGALAEETATAYLAGRLTEELTEGLSGKAGLDLIAIDPLHVNGQGDPTTRVTLGKQVTPDLFVAYSDDIGSNLGSIYQLDYSITRQVRLASVRDSDGSIGGDLSFTVRQSPPSLPGLEPSGAPRRDPLIGSVAVEGQMRYEEKKIRRRLRLKSGRPRQRVVVNEAIERLLNFYHDHGHLMAEVYIDEDPVDEENVNLVVRVSAGPKVSIEIEGVRGREGLRQTIAPQWQRGLFPEDIVESARLHLETAFRDRGYLGAEVQAEILRNDARHLNVRFTVRRGPRVQADAVRVLGTSQLTEKEVLRVVRTSPDTLFSRGIVGRGRLRGDAGAIREHYFSRGFPGASVTEPEVVIDATGRRAIVTFEVDEGRRMVVRRVRFEGAESLPRERVHGAAAHLEGATYNYAAAGAAAVLLRRVYDDSGFPDARVDVRLEPVAVSPETEETDLVFVVSEGVRQTVGRVEIRGNLVTREDVIRKSLSVLPGRSLSRNDMLASQSRLYRLGIMNSVQIEARPADELPLAALAGPPITGDTAAGPAIPGNDGRPGRTGEGAPGSVSPGERRTVRVTIREAGPLRQVFGLGYDSVENARGQYEIANRNILGSGRYLGLQTRGSRLKQSASLLYREGGVFGGRFDALASAFWQEEVRPAFDERTIGTSIQLSRRVTPASRLLYRYSLRDVDLSDASATILGTTLRLSSLSASAVHDTRDSPFNPMRGHYMGAEAKVFGRALGSDADFTKVYAQFYFFREVLPKTIWAQAIRAGAANPFGRSQEDPTSTGDAISGVPPSERFFAGGDTTLRGFGRDLVGEVDASGDPVGGEGLFLLNEELRFPIFRKLQGVVFYDAGNVYRTLGNYSLGDLRHVAGAGLHVATPIGPFRLEYGAILDRRAGEPRGEFFFSIGQAF